MFHSVFYLLASKSASQVYLALCFLFWIRPFEFEWMGKTIFGRKHHQPYDVLNELHWSQHFKGNMATLYYVLTLVGILLLGVRVFMVWRVKGTKKIKKRGVLFSMFYVPDFL